VRRYYLSKVVGSGTSHADMVHAKAADLAAAVGGNCSATIRSGSVAGDWCLAVVDCRDHTALMADPDLRDFPDLTLDAQLSTISATLRNRLLTALQTAGIDTTGITNSTAFRTVVRRAGQKFDTAFTENAFDVAPAP